MLYFWQMATSLNVMIRLTLLTDQHPEMLEDIAYALERLSRDNLFVY